MSVLITGAKGFIGQHLTNLLEKDYEMLKVISAQPDCQEENVYGADFELKENVEKLFSNIKRYEVDTFIHLAGKTMDRDNTKSLEIFKRNVLIAENVAWLIERLKPKKLINFSSMSVYPNISGVFSEQSSLGVDCNNDCFYGLSKYSSEVIFNFLLSSKIESILHLRIAQVHGLGINPDRIMPTFKNELLQNNTITIFGDGSRTSNFIEVRSLCDIIYELMKINCSGVLNIGHQNLSINDIAEKCIKKYGNSDTKIIRIKKDIPSEKFVLDTKKLGQLINTKNIIFRDLYED